MGFGESISKKALKMSQGNFDTALDLLVSGKVNDTETDMGSSFQKEDYTNKLTIQTLIAQIHEKYTQAAAKAALSALLRYLSNILQDPSNEKYRTIRSTNSFFQENIFRVQEAINILELCGFKRDSEFWVKKGSDVGIVWLAKGLIEQHLSWD